MPRLSTRWKLISVALLVAFGVAMWLAPLVAALFALAVVAVIGVFNIPSVGNAFFRGYMFPKSENDYYKDDEAKRRQP